MTDEERIMPENVRIDHMRRIIDGPANSPARVFFNVFMDALPSTWDKSVHSTQFVLAVAMAHAVEAAAVQVAINLRENGEST